jgi:hypothetical protein
MFEYFNTKRCGEVDLPSYPLKVIASLPKMEFATIRVIRVAKSSDINHVVGKLLVAPRFHSECMGI